MLPVTLSSIAVPGFNGFIGEFLILVGSWRFDWRLTALASLGVILAAAYLLWMVQRVLYGEVTNPKNEGLKDLSWREALVLVPLVVLSLVMGVASPYFTRDIEPAIQSLVVQRPLSAPPPASPSPAAPAAPGAGSGGH